ncbi:uncharacterized protein LOC143031048, partial [Oratosquilla oratoria]|uniref:uncharacterized protein LOC143031048 n=1 Tax=Oratosquilla oratoria TaxID=337810 RepID=UPI003F757E95
MSWYQGDSVLAQIEHRTRRAAHRNKKITNNKPQKQPSARNQSDREKEPGAPRRVVTAAMRTTENKIVASSHLALVLLLLLVVAFVDVAQGETQLNCWGMDCGSALEMECCNFSIGKCCNKQKTYCNETMCGSKADSWYCGTCHSFIDNDCCNDRLTICRGTTCGYKEDYECCPDGSPRSCCSILPPTVPPPSVAQEWWFWVGLIIMFLSLGFIGFVLWSDRLFIKYQIDKVLGKNPQRPEGMPFHRRASVRLRSGIKGSRQAVRRASVRLSNRRRRRPDLTKLEEEKDDGSRGGVDNPEITALGVPPPEVPGPPSLDGVRPTRAPENVYVEVRSRSTAG